MNVSAADPIAETADAGPAGGAKHHMPRERRLPVVVTSTLSPICAVAPRAIGTIMSSGKTVVRFVCLVT
jgi:hypothetical protein